MALKLHLLLFKAFYVPGERVDCAIQVYCDGAGGTSGAVRLQSLTLLSAGQERADTQWIKRLHRSEVPVEVVEQRRGVRTLYRTEPATLLQNITLLPGAAHQFRARFRLPARLPPSFKGQCCRFTYFLDAKAVYSQAGDGGAPARFETTAATPLVIWPGVAMASPAGLPLRGQHLAHAANQASTPFASSSTGPSLDGVATAAGAGVGAASRQALRPTASSSDLQGPSSRSAAPGDASEGGAGLRTRLSGPQGGSGGGAMPRAASGLGAGHADGARAVPWTDYALQQRVKLRWKEVPVDFLVLQEQLLRSSASGSAGGGYYGGSVGTGANSLQPTMPTTPSPSMLSLVELGNGGLRLASRERSTVGLTPATSTASAYYVRSPGPDGLDDSSSDFSSSDGEGEGGRQGLEAAVLPPRRLHRGMSGGGGQLLPPPPSSRQPGGQPSFGHPYSLKIGDLTILRVVLQGPLDTPLQPGTSFGGVVDLRPAGLKTPPQLACHQIVVLLETEEVVPAEYTARGSASRRGSPAGIRKLYAEHQELTSHLAVTQFMFQIPASCTPSFDTPMVSLRWLLRFELVIGPWAPVPCAGVEKAPTPKPAVTSQPEQMLWTLPLVVQTPAWG